MLPRSARDPLSLTDRGNQDAWHEWYVLTDVALAGDFFFQLFEAVSSKQFSAIFKSGAVFFFAFLQNVS